jgi:hypothetical protein
LLASAFPAATVGSFVGGFAAHPIAATHKNIPHAAEHPTAIARL